MKISVNNSEYEITPLAEEDIVSGIMGRFLWSYNDGDDDKAYHPLKEWLVAPFFAEFYESKNPVIREHVARHLTYIGGDNKETKIARTIVSCLCADSQNSVVDVLLGNDYVLVLLTEKQVISIIDRGDAGILEKLASNLAALDIFDHSIIEQRLVSSEIPAVKRILSGNSFISESVLETLAEDEDPSISRSAENSLREKRGDLEDIDDLESFDDDD